MKDSNSESDAQQTALQVASVYKSINFVSVGIAVLLSGGMIFDKHSVTVSMLSGIGVYGLIASLLILWQPGALPYVLTNRQHEVTERKRDELQYQLQMAHTPPPQRVNLVDPVQIGYAGDTGTLRIPDAPSYVPAVPPADEQLKLNAYTFVRALFSEEGEPLPKRILDNHTKSPGLVQYEKPKPEVMQYLTGLQMVWENERKQLFFNKESYPTLRYCMHAISLGVPAGRGGTLPLLHERSGG